MSEEYVCSKCGEKAQSDSRGGSLDVYLVCNCRNRGTWVNDGRGGYWATDAKPIPAKDYYDK